MLPTKSIWSPSKVWQCANRPWPCFLYPLAFTSRRFQKKGDSWKPFGNMRARNHQWKEKIMKYFNWQQIHKKALNSKTKNNERSAGVSNSNLPIEIVHMRAWAELSRICLATELDRLQALALQYETGDRLHDTYYISPIAWMLSLQKVWYLSLSF